MAKSKQLIWIEYIIARALLFLLRIVPRSWALRVGAGFGYLLYYLLPAARRTVRDNLHVAFGTAKNKKKRRILSRAIFAHLGRNLFEFLQFPRFSQEQLAAQLTFKNITIMEQALAQGKGVIVVSAHIGNWEMLAAGFASAGYPLQAIVRLLDNPLLDRYVEGFRESKGVHIIPRSRAVPGSLRALRKGSVVAFMMDQNAAANGIFVPFFGKPASTVQGPALLAIRSGAPVLFAYSLRRPNGGHDVYIDPPFQLLQGDSLEESIALNTAQYTAAIERAVQENPEQWLWLHPRWRTQPFDA